MKSLKRNQSAMNQFQIFEESRRYAYSGRPVIVSDAQVNWTAGRIFSFEFFRQLYVEDADYGSGQARCQFFPYKTEFDSLHQALTMTEERRKQPWYFGWYNPFYVLYKQRIVFKINGNTIRIC